MNLHQGNSHRKLRAQPWTTKNGEQGVFNIELSQAMFKAWA